MERMRALVRTPGESVASGLRMLDRGAVSVAGAFAQHAAYRALLEKLGFRVVVLGPLEEYPDSVFVEDPAIVIRDLVIQARLKDPARQGEEKYLCAELQAYFYRFVAITPPGFVEGGDVVVCNERLFIGLSERTNELGAEQLARFARDWLGFDSRIFRIPKSYLHLKGEATYHPPRERDGTGLFTVSEEISEHFQDSGCAVIETPADERFGANCISRGAKIIVHAGRTKTKARLMKLGYEVFDLDISEFEKIDGAMTCLSKLF